VGQTAAHHKWTRKRLARLDMGGLELGSMAEAKPNAQSFFERHHLFE
jgi:hypothetical protein